MNRDTALKLCESINRICDELTTIQKTIKKDLLLPQEKGTETPKVNIGAIKRPRVTPLNIPEGWNSCEAHYNRNTNVLEIDAREEDIHPKYLEYMLEHIGLPKNTEVHFTK